MSDLNQIYIALGVIVLLILLLDKHIDRKY